jgi:hypothetical protein
VKEAIAVAIMEAMGDKMIVHDDKLLLRALKTRVQTGRGRPGGVGLEEDWWRYVPIAIDNEGNQEFTGYWNQGIGEHHGPGWETTDEGKRRLEQEPGWKPSYRRRLKIGEGVYVAMEGNQVDLFIGNLYENMGSRYKEALEYLVDMVDRGIVRYQPRAEPSDRRKKEAIRNRLKREFRITAYEHNVLFRGEIGRELFKQFRTVAGHEQAMVLEEGTIYLKGFNHYKGLKRAVKYYDIGKREDSEPGEFFKLETTLLKEYFKSQGMGVSDMLEQPDIQERIKNELEKAIEGALCLVSEETMNGIQRELELEGRATVREVTRAMLNSRMTLSERVAELERRMTATERDIAVLKAKAQVK